MCKTCNQLHIISLSLLSVVMPVQGAIGFRFGAGEVGKASLAYIIRDVSPFVQVSVRGHIGSESITPRTGSEAPNGTQRLTLD